MKKLLLLVFGFCLIAPHLAHGGAWTLPENSIWMEQTSKHTWAKNDFKSDGGVHRKGDWTDPDTGENITQGGKTWIWSSITQAEYGIKDWLTALGGFEYKDGNYKEYNKPFDPPDDHFSVSNQAFTNMELGLRGRIMEEPVVLSAQITGIWYLGGKGVEEESMQLADGNDTLELRALAGKMWDEAVIPFYLGAEAGYRLNNRGIQNRIPLFAEVGLWPLEWLMVKNDLDIVLGHKGTGSADKSWLIWRAGPTIQLLDLWATITGRERTRRTSGVLREDRSLDLSIQYGRTLWGENTAKDQEITVQLATQF